MARGEAQGWWSRNWAWALPVGGCGGCLVLVLLVVGGGVLLGGKALEGLSDAAGDDEAIARAEANPRVVELIGTPLKKKMGFNGSVNINNGETHADYRISISGPRGEATLSVQGVKDAGGWSYDHLECRVTEVDGKLHDERIDLLEGNEGLEEDAQEGEVPDDAIEEAEEAVAGAAAA